MTEQRVTEQRPCEWPVVYGYLRLSNPNEARRTALVTVLRVYCAKHELRLATVFTDYGTMQIRPPAGFIGLRDVLELTDTYGAVIPSRAHLGRGDIAAARTRQIARTGSRLIVVRHHQRAMHVMAQQPQPKSVQ